MSPITARALHFVFKIGNRPANVQFFREVLGMKVLRHEEFNEGCEAACNGPYNNRWSKTMIGYGPESEHFVMELTWNTMVDNYKRGNDFFGITISSSQALERARDHKLEITEEDVGNYLIYSPDGYPFYILDKPQEELKDPVMKVSLASTNIGNSVKYWHGLLGMNVLYNDENRALFTFGEGQTCLEFKKIDGLIDHATAYGRIAFAVPKIHLKDIEAKAMENKHKVLTPLIELDTPGKATVTVVILADPDGHEICFVDEENFSLLSKTDPEANSLLDKEISKYQKHLEKEALKIK